MAGQMLEIEDRTVHLELMQFHEYIEGLHT